MLFTVIAFCCECCNAVDVHCISGISADFLLQVCIRSTCSQSAWFILIHQFAMSLSRSSAFDVRKKNRLKCDVLFTLQLFTTARGHLDDSDEGNDDLSDSEESVFSGLEDSGSDDESGDNEEAEELHSAEEKADVNENGESTTEAESSNPSTKTADKTQVWSFNICSFYLVENLCM